MAPLALVNHVAEFDSKHYLSFDRLHTKITSTKGRRFIQTQRTIVSEWPTIRQLTVHLSRRVIGESDIRNHAPTQKGLASNRGRRK